MIITQTIRISFPSTEDETQLLRLPKSKESHKTYAMPVGIYFEILCYQMPMNSFVAMLKMMTQSLLISAVIKTSMDTEIREAWTQTYLHHLCIKVVSALSITIHQASTVMAFMYTDYTSASYTNLRSTCVASYQIWHLKHRS